ncbi:MAG TPA: 50S ribosomal protein L11 methyltransferase [Desulfobacteraceae bacterium]|nr:50S ribosomal protein L11 methyltransferase [Desulfobacteraceae bacterium]HPJ68179.1 50S ribosomal protein L11 methyltransferase [Desulfobacteraceae bacterium]HPQ28327.1 50S ribosomal protein L11 methyltransferase [Desulfobacteraceae bacterium]
MSAIKSDHGEWLKISINTHPITHEALSAFLFDLGCTGIVTEDFQDHSLTAYLPLPYDLEKIRANINSYLKGLEAIFPEVQAALFELVKVKDNGWNRNWRGFFSAEIISANLIIVPAWEPRPPETNGIVLKIDPGPAFGTGQHPTTQMCLRMIEKLSKPEQWTMLDVGTGSGILSIYAAKLKASRILAIDIDPEAVRWAKRNVILNDLAGKIELSTQRLDKIAGSFSFVVANLFFEEIIGLFPLFQGLLNPGGWLVLSGILRDQEKDLRDMLDKYNFYDYEVLYQEEWACLASKRVL